MDTVNDVDNEHDGPDPAPAHCRGARERVLDAPMLTPMELDAILGITAATLDLGAIEGALVAVEGLRGMLIPAFQVDVEAAVVRPLVAELNRDFLDAKNDPWGAGVWWLTPSETLPEAMSPADAVVAGGHDDLLRQLAAVVAADWEPTVLPLTGISLDEARTRITALHFAREALSPAEDGLLTIAEGLLRLLDVRSGGTAR